MEDIQKTVLELAKERGKVIDRLIMAGIRIYIKPRPK